MRWLHSHPNHNQLHRVYGTKTKLPTGIEVNTANSLGSGGREGRGLLPDALRSSAPRCPSRSVLTPSRPPSPLPQPRWSPQGTERPCHPHLKHSVSTTRRENPGFTFRILVGLAKGGRPSRRPLPSQGPSPVLTPRAPSGPPLLPPSFSFLHLRSRPREENPSPKEPALLPEVTHS